MHPTHKLYVRGLPERRQGGRPDSGSLGSRSAVGSVHHREPVEQPVCGRALAGVGMRIGQNIDT
eukprot:COSAG01_NODE_38686_length_486_cov_1.521964_1_plen_63_part_10